jgi:Domain of unknown function (DUF4760)
VNKPNGVVKSVLPDVTHTTIISSQAAQQGLSPFLTPTVALLSLIVTATIALRALHNTRSVARQKATLDLIEKRESTEHYRKISRTFFELQRGAGFLHLVDPIEADKPLRKDVFDYLNHYEIISIGIRQDILDERIYRAWMEGAFVRDWNAASDFIQRERWKYAKDETWNYRHSIYQNYQHIACRWSKDARILSQESSPPPEYPAGPGDTSLPRPVDSVKLDD